MAEVLPGNLKEIRVQAEPGYGVVSATFKELYNWAELIAEYALPTFPYSPRNKEWLARNMGVELSQLEPWYAHIPYGIFALDSLNHSLLGHDEGRSKISQTQLLLLTDYVDPLVVSEMVIGLGLGASILYTPDAYPGGYSSPVTLYYDKTFTYERFAVLQCTVDPEALPPVLAAGINLSRS
jgi:hypothetical protein